MSLPHLASYLSVPLSTSALTRLLLWLCSEIGELLSPGLLSPLILKPRPSLTGRGALKETPSLLPSTPHLLFPVPEMELPQDSHSRKMVLIKTIETRDGEVRWVT